MDPIDDGPSRAGGRQGRRRRSVLGLLGLVALGVLTVAGCLLGRSRLTYEGRLPGKPVVEPVEIVRDGQGVPHILAGNPGDLFFGLGYAMAQDRLFQMDLYRHLAHGRLSEWFGNLPLGKGIRLIQLDMLLKCFETGERAGEAWGRIDPDSRALLGRFVEGINESIADRQGSPPFGYRMIRVEPDPWTAPDVLAVAEIFGIGMGLVNAQTEILRDAMERVLGSDLSDDFFRRYAGSEGPGMQVRTEEGSPSGQGIPAGYGSFFLLGSLLRAGVPQGSNNWAVSADRSASGMPMLANDPHVPLGFSPSFWYHADLEGGGFSVQGLLYPGYPAFGAGWNGSVAWGVTNIMADQMDLVREQVDPSDPSRYLAPGGWKSFESSRIPVRVRLGKDREFVLRKGIHGFLLPREALENDYSRDAPWLLDPLSVQYVDTDPAAFFQGHLQLMRAREGRDVKEALGKIGQGPTAFHYVWATRAGDIGLQAAGRIPDRGGREGSRMGAGARAGPGWQGYVPFGELLSRTNPPEGFFNSSNERVAPADYPWYITDDYARPYRSQRVRSVLSRQGSFCPGDFMALQGDLHNLIAERLLPFLFGAVERQEGAGSLDAEDRKALELLKDWDLQTLADSGGAALFELFHQCLLEEIFSDEAGEELSEMLLRVNVMAGKVMDDLLDEPESVWFDRRDTPEKEDRDTILVAAFREARKRCGKWMGRDPGNWAWGKVHDLYLGHPLGLVPVLGRPYRIGTFPYPGDFDTVNGAHFVVEKKRFRVFAGAASRIVVDLARTDGAWFNCSTGMSEEPSSPYFENLTPGWYRNEHFWTRRMERPREIQAAKRLLLTP